MKRIVCAILIAVLLWTGAVAEWTGLWVNYYKEPGDQSVYVLILNEDGTAIMHMLAWKDGQLVLDFEQEQGRWTSTYKAAYVTMSRGLNILMEQTKDGKCYATEYINNELFGYLIMTQVPYDK